MGGRQCYEPKTGPPQPWNCWKENIVKKTGGFWYSTVSDGYCGPGETQTASGGPCMWRVDTGALRAWHVCSIDCLTVALWLQSSRRSRRTVPMTSSVSTATVGLGCVTCRL